MKRLLISTAIVLAFHLPGVLYGQQVESIDDIAADPTATILGTQTEVCAGDSVEAYLFFTEEKNAPWDAIINNNSGVYLELEDVETPYTIWLKPLVDDRYYIDYVEDNKGNEGKTYGEVEVFVYETTPVSIQLDRTAFRQSEPGVNLEGTPPGGLYTGNGIAGDVFYPFIATTDGSPHHITYSYTNEYGCTSSDAIDIHVLYGEGEVNLFSGTEPINSLCDNGETYLIKGSNLDNISGTFELRTAGSSDSVPGHISDNDLLDDQATLDPTGLVGLYDIIYTYSFQDLIVELQHRFQVSDLGLLGITDLPGEVCKNDEPYLLVPELVEVDTGAIFEFSGPGVSGNQDNGFYYDPGDPDAPAGENLITLNYTSSEGCSSNLTHVMTNGFVPGVQFSIAPVCIPEGGGMVDFENLTGRKDVVDKWSWDFGDSISGEDNYSNLENPEHFYAESGSRSISLTATTSQGCEAVFSLDTLLPDQPVADFTWLNDCYIEGQKVAFLDRSTSTFSSLDTFQWTFKTADGNVLDVIAGTSITDTAEVSFPGMDNYLVDYQVQNQVGCVGMVSKEIVLKPFMSIPATGYEEDFNGVKTDWFSGPVGQDLSWIRAEPDFPGFNQTLGDFSWFTDLPVDNPAYLEHSWVQSNCFDFSENRFPFIQMDLMKSLTPGMDGSVLQYQHLVSEGWKTIGNLGDGLNWYNVTGLHNKPGGSSTGWGLDLFNPDTRWVKASHDLDLVAGLPYVKFRIAIATGGEMEIGSGRYNNGFAFDNIYIGEHIRRSLLEHFTNSSSMESMEADDVVDQFVMAHSGSVIDLQYHMDYPGMDPMNLNNPFPPATRAFAFGIQGVPSAVLNGGSRSEHLFDFSDPANEPNDDVLQQANLEIPVFDMDLDVNWFENRLEATSLVTCKTDTFNSYVQLYIAVIESYVTAYTGSNQDTMFRNVVLDILPSPAGKLLGSEWYDGKTDSRSYSWDYQEYIEDIDDLAVVAFIQDRDHGQVLQVATAYLTPLVGQADKYQETRSLSIYPNPARDQLYVNIGSRHKNIGQIVFLDLSGKTVKVMDIQPDNSLYQLNVANLSMGMYMIYWIDSGVVRGREKLVITR